MNSQDNSSEDAEEVLADSALIIAQLQCVYKNAEADEELSYVSKTQVKAAVEGLRSALEYTAQQIWRSYTKKKNKVYFPYGADIEKFHASVKRSLPALKEQSPSLYALVESIQPHITGETWLSELCSVSNFNKHNGLSKQTRKNSPGKTLSIGDGAIVLKDSSNLVIHNGYIDGVPLSLKGSLRLSSLSSEEDVRNQVNRLIPLTRNFDWVEFHIDIINSDVLSMLNRSHQMISVFVKSASSEIKRLASTDGRH